MVRVRYWRSWTRLLLLALCGLVMALDVARGESVGDLGGADRLVVRGLETTLAASLRQGLLADGDLYWRGIPTADQAAYLAALRTRIPLALEAAGFPEPRVTVEVGPGPDGKESVLVDVVAGPRLMAGPIRVKGISDDMALRLMTYLQESQPPADAVPETITLPDGSKKVLWFDAKGDPATPGSPAWTPGTPAPCGERCASGLLTSVAGFFRGEGCIAIDGGKHAWEKGYLDAIREHVDLAVRAEGEHAVLAIDVKRLPARTTLVGIEVNDGLRTTAADLLAYLGTTVGQPVTMADRRAWLGRLRLSGRFIKQACRFEPRDGGCVARFELVEYRKAAPLARDASPEQESLLRARAWLMSAWHGGREIHFKVTLQGENKADGPWGRCIEFITGRETGSVVKVEGGDWPCAAACGQGMTGLFTDTSRFEGALPVGLAPRITVKLAIDEKDQEPTFSVGYGNGSALVSFQIEPVCCNAVGMTSRRDGDELVLEIDDADGRREIRLDAVSGRPRRLVSIGESGRIEIRIETGDGLAAQALGDLRSRAGKNLADANQPVSSFVRFALVTRSPFHDAVRLAAAMAMGDEIDDDAITQWIQSMQTALDTDSFAAIDAAVGKSLRAMRDAEAADAPERLTIPVSREEELAHVRSLFATRTAAMTTEINGVPVAPPIDDHIRPALMTQHAPEPLLGRELGRALAAGAAPMLRSVERMAGRDSAAAPVARAAVLVVSSADHAAAARELARVPATSLWTPELEALCAAVGPRGRELDRRAREALAYLHGVAGDTAWSLAAYRRLLAEVEEQHGPDHPETSKYVHNLVWLLNRSGGEKEAYALARRPRVAIEGNFGTSQGGLHLPTPARFKQPQQDTRANDDKTRDKTRQKTADGAPQPVSSGRPDAERWGGLNRDLLKTIR